jgi:hypothetical protein
MTFASRPAITRGVTWLRHASPAAIIALVSILTVAPLVHTPLTSHDHPIHLFKAWQFFHEHLLHGELRGWSHAWSLALAGQPCEKRGELDFVCGTTALRPKYVSGSQGNHVCMATDDRSRLNLDVLTELGSALLFYYDPDPTEGEIKLLVSGEPLGTAAARFPDIDFRILHFDTHKFQGKGKLPLHLEVTRGPLRCFDLRVVP